jgi:hypothetical protein
MSLMDWRPHLSFFPFPRAKLARHVQCAALPWQSDGNAQIRRRLGLDCTYGLLVIRRNDLLLRIRWLWRLRGVDSVSTVQ